MKENSCSSVATNEQVQKNAEGPNNWISRVLSPPATGTEMPPFFRHVSEPGLSSLQRRLEDLSRLTTSFLMLLSASTVIATLGLFQNSPAVIIGAMIIAPLMRPLVGLSLGTLTGDSRLIARAVITLAVGTILGVILSAILGLIFRSLELTPEILNRTHPTLLDMGVAIAAGAIGAYCQANEKLSESLAGVAISVALVPPLSVVGIGIAFGAITVSFGALLLYATNLVGITVAGAIVFLLLGYTPLHQATKGLALSAFVSLVLIIPLGFSMRELVVENQISANIKYILKEKTLTFKDVQLDSVKVERFREPMIVSATVMAPEQPITQRQVTLVREFLVKELNIPIEFKLKIIPVTQIQSEVSATDGNATTVDHSIRPERTDNQNSDNSPVEPDQTTAAETEPSTENSSEGNSSPAEQIPPSALGSTKQPQVQQSQQLQQEQQQSAPQQLPQPTDNQSGANTEQ